MSRTTQRLRRVGVALGVTLAVILGAGAWVFRVDEVPAELPPVAASMALQLRPLAGGTPITLGPDGASLTDRTTFFVVVGPQSLKNREGEALHRALNRWSFAKGVAGRIIADVEGFGLMAAKVEEVLGHFASEVRFDVHMDFDGAFVTRYGLAKGHSGLVVLDSTGKVLFRHSGEATPADIEAIRTLLQAEEPALGPPAPAFAAGSLSDAVCGHPKPCALVFLGRDIVRTEIPELDGGFTGTGDEVAKQYEDPAVRMVYLGLKLKHGDKSLGAIVGRTQGLDFPSWVQIEDTPALREAFGMDPGVAGVVLIDGQGRVAMDERGAVPMYKLGRVAEILGVELDRGDDDEL